MLFNNNIEASQFGLNDDWITDLLLDKVGFSPSVRKFTNGYDQLRVPKDEIHSALGAVVRQGDFLETVSQLLKTLYRYGYLAQLSKPIHFKAQLMAYVQTYSPDCEFEVNLTCQYSNIPQACITTRKPIERCIIKYLYGFLVPLEPDVEEDLESTGRDFTIVASNRSTVQSLFLGPGRFVNHDCDGNAELRPVKDGMQVFASRYIGVGEEITVNYGSHYFGRDNSDCLCATCASMGRNGWKAENHTEGTAARRPVPKMTIYTRPSRLRKLRVRDRTSPLCTICQSHRKCFRCQRHLRIYRCRWPRTTAKGKAALRQ